MKNAARREEKTLEMLPVYHRFYCPRCKAFVPHDVKSEAATFTFICMVCSSTERFIGFAGLCVPEGLDALLRETAKTRLKEGLIDRRRA